jgi:dTDP-4-dehydrorhamnose 3,5-epimerase
MNFRKHADGWIIEPTNIRDSRGSLAKTYDQQEFENMGLNTRWPEHLQTITSGCGNVRGMHWQEAPHGQIKLVRCVVGWVHDVIVDIRPDSPDFGKPHYAELTGDKMHSLYIPDGYAHGFQCVSESCIMHYSLSSPFNANAARRFHYKDPMVGIKWPVLVMKVSDADASAPLLSDAIHAAH